MGNFHPHHQGSLRHSRDGLTNVIQSLRSATERMVGEPWFAAETLLREITDDIAPRLSVLCDEASERLVAHRQLDDFADMHAGRTPYPDERDVPSKYPESAGFPNAKVGERLVIKHGSVDAARMAYQPDSHEFDCIQAWVYISTGVRPQGWVPPVVQNAREGPECD
jgi:hypothetical protein